MNRFEIIQGALFSCLLPSYIGIFSKNIDKKTWRAYNDDKKTWQRGI